jgi:hypothetical protein
MSDGTAGRTSRTFRKMKLMQESDVKILLQLKLF